MSLLRRWVLAFVAPKPLVGALYLPRYLRDWLAFRTAAPAASRPRLRDSYPCLSDWSPSTPFEIASAFIPVISWMLTILRRPSPRRAT